MTTVDIGDYLSASLALAALLTLIRLGIKFRANLHPTAPQLATFGICGFIVSIASGFILTLGCFMIAIMNSPGWPMGSQKPPIWAEYLFVMSIPLGIGITLIGFTWTAKFIFRQSIKPITPAPTPTSEDATP